MQFIPSGETVVNRGPSAHFVSQSGATGIASTDLGNPFGLTALTPQPGIPLKSEDGLNAVALTFTFDTPIKGAAADVVVGTGLLEVDAYGVAVKLIGTFSVDHDRG